MSGVEAFPTGKLVAYDPKGQWDARNAETGRVVGRSTSGYYVYVDFDGDDLGAKAVAPHLLMPLTDDGEGPDLPEPVTIPLADPPPPTGPLDPVDGPRPGRSLLPLSEDEADLIRALRGDDVALTRTRVRRAVTDWFNEGDPLLNEQIESLTDRIVVAIERKS